MALHDEFERKADAHDLALPPVGPVSSQPSLPSQKPKVLPPPRMERDELSLKKLWRVSLFHWRENPVVRLLWKKMRLWAIILALVVTLMTIVSQILGKNFVNNPAMTATFWFGMIASLVWSLAAFAAQIYYPIFIGRWGYERSFVKDDNLKAAPLNFNDRLMGILLPGVAAYLLYVAITLPLSQFVTLIYMNEQATPLGEHFNYFAIIYGLLTTLTFTFGYILLTVTVALRRMIQLGEAGRGTHAGILYIAIPYLIAGGMAIALGCVSGMAMMAMVAPAMGQAGAGWQLTGLLFSLGLIIVISIVWTYLLFMIMQTLWMSDLPIARQTLFQLED